MINICGVEFRTVDHHVAPAEATPMLQNPSQIQECLESVNELLARRSSAADEEDTGREDSAAGYLQAFPHVAQACFSSEMLLSLMDKIFVLGANDDTSLVVNTSVPELEARLGKIDSETGYFQPGVTYRFLERALSMVDSFAEWTDVSDWERTHDFFHFVVLGGKQVEVRSTVKFGTLEKPFDAAKTIHIIKQPLCKSTYATHPIPNGFDSNLYDVRVSLMREIPVEVQTIPDLTLPHRVRIKRRKTYSYGSCRDAVIRPVWKFEFTQCWEGSTKAEAETKQKTNTGTRYEIECECVDPVHYRKKQMQDNRYVLLSLLLKITDFFISAKDTFKVGVFAETQCTL